jgi:ABC-2 type transport system ATP-binding protein
MIQVEDVTRLYGELRAVDSVHFQVTPGEIVGFLGPNGAGKSTLLKMMATYLAPSEGTIQIAGHDVVKQPLEARSRLGYLAEHNALYDGMRVDRYLTFIGQARGLGKADIAKRIAWTSGRCDLGSVLKKRIRECSKGFRQRIGLAAALLHDPSVLLLDEPTHGLDPLQVVAFRDFLHELQEGRAILFSSHILAEVLEISDRLIVLQQGRLVLDESVASLRERAANGDVESVVLDSIRQEGSA